MRTSRAALDDGATWTTVPGNRTTNSNPNGNNRGNGITGLSGGWVSATFDLRVSWWARRAACSEVPLLDRRVGEQRRALCRLRESGHLRRAERCRSPRTSRRPGTTAGRTETRELHLLRESLRRRGAREQNERSRRCRSTISRPSTPPARASSLDQNYPNPFNPATTLWFNVGASEAPGDGTASDEPAAL